MTTTNTAKTYSEGRYTAYFNPKYGTYDEYVEMLRETLYSWRVNSVPHDEYDLDDEYKAYHRFIEETNFDE